MIGEGKQVFFVTIKGVRAFHALEASKEEPNTKGSATTISTLCWKRKRSERINEISFLEVEIVNKELRIERAYLFSNRILFFCFFIHYDLK